MRPLIDLNSGRRKVYPKITIGRPDEEDVTALVDNLVKLVPFGLKVSMGWTRDKLGAPEPAEGEDVLQAAAPVAPPPGVLPFDKNAPVISASTAGAGKTDAVDSAVSDIVGDGWEEMIEPMVSGLSDQLATAGSLEEAQAIISRQLNTMGIAKLAETLARATFAARLAGETGEAL